MNAIQNSLELGVDLVRCLVIVLIGHFVELGTLKKRERVKMCVKIKYLLKIPLLFRIKIYAFMCIPNPFAVAHSMNRRMGTFIDIKSSQ